MSRRHRLADLRSVVPVVLPSLLLCDFGDLASEIRRLEAANVRALHMDVMDGHFVPNFTYGMTIVEAVRKLTDLPLDVHLMIERPEKYLRAFYDAGADIITVHAEATVPPGSTRRLAELLAEIRGLGAGAGLAINPPTLVSAIESCLSACDVVLVMSVQAGFGGQEFNPVALDKLRELRAKVGPNVLLEIDGGITTETIRPAAEAGAQMFVVGSAIFRNNDYSQSVAQLTRLAADRRNKSGGSHENRRPA
jgi:ribulose-phosphate 3-epimerase